MSFLDKLRGNAKKAVDQHGDKLHRGLDQAAKAVDKRTGHKHSDKINKGVAKAKDGLNRLDDKNGPGGSSDPGAPPPSR